MIRILFASLIVLVVLVSICIGAGILWGTKQIDGYYKNKYQPKDNDETENKEH